MARARREYGEGSIYQKTDGRWAGVIDAGFTERGTRRRVTVTGKTEAEARRRLRDKRKQLRDVAASSQATGATRKTVRTWVADWLPMRQRTMRPKTYEADESLTRLYIVPAVGQKRLMDLVPMDLRVVEAKARAAGHGKPTILKARLTFVRLLRDAVAHGYSVPPAMFTPLRDTTKTSRRTAPKRAALELHQAVAVMGQAADLPHGSRWLVGFYQGLRQGETLGLRWSDIDFDTGLIVVRHQLQPLPYLDRTDPSRGFRLPEDDDDYDPIHLAGRFHLVPLKTEAGQRVIPLVPTIRDALLRHRATDPGNPHGLVWARPGGWPIDKATDAEEFRALQRAAGVRKAVDTAGEPVLYTGHEMRNTTATILRESGADPITITAVLGHSSYATSQAYMTQRNAHTAAALAGVEQMFTTKALG